MDKVGRTWGKPFRVQCEHGLKRNLCWSVRGHRQHTCIACAPVSGSIPRGFRPPLPRLEPGVGGPDPLHPIPCCSASFPFLSENLSLAHFSSFRKIHFQKLSRTPLQKFLTVLSAGCLFGNVFQSLWHCKNCAWHFESRQDLGILLLRGRFLGRLRRGPDCKRCPLGCEP